MLPIAMLQFLLQLVNTRLAIVQNYIHRWHRTLGICHRILLDEDKALDQLQKIEIHGLTLKARYMMRGRKCNPIKLQMIAGQNNRGSDHSKKQTKGFMQSFYLYTC